MTTPSDFIIWLGGFVDALAGQTPTPTQWATINGKLDSVFNKVTPDRTITVTRTLDTSTQGYNTPAYGVVYYTGHPEFITTGPPTGDIRTFYKPITAYSGVLGGYGDADRVERFAISTTC